MLPCFQIDILVLELKSFYQWLEGGDFAESHNSYTYRFVLKSHVARLVGKFQGCLRSYWSSLPGRPSYESAYPPYVTR